MALAKRYLEVLSPYLEAGDPNDQDEIGMRCPLHNDSKRSASVNVEKGLWFCNACNLGGPVKDLVKTIEQGGAAHHGQGDSSSKRSASSKRSDTTKVFPYTDNHVRAWQAQLQSNDEVRLALQDRRGLEAETIAEFEIGWDSSDRAYTIPIRDVNGELVNIRWYQLDPPDDRRKIWGVTGFNEPKLYPVDELLESQEIIWCEGELDALICIQNGLPAITRTGGAKVWKPEWASEFVGKDVYVCQDTDKDGQIGARRVAMGLRQSATSAQVVTLPYPITDKHGKDLTDFFTEGGTKDELYALMVASRTEQPKQSFEDVRVIDSFNSNRFGEPMRMRVTVTGKRNPPYMVPQDVEFSCTMDAGPKCKACPMMGSQGIMRRTIPAKDPVILGMLDASADNVKQLLRQESDIIKCDRLVVDVQRYQTVEEIFVRPSVDVQLTTNDAGDYTTRRVFVVGPHDTLPNTTVEIVGGIHPGPRSQRNEMLSWSCSKVETSIDKFTMTPEIVEALSIFKVPSGGDVLHKMEEIADDLTANVTRIYGRTTMHMLIDIVFHSALSFDFGNQSIYRGWIDAMLLGDTRTGKSEAAERQRRHYQLGEMISCESASFAGLVGGLQQLNNNAWEVTWGCIPLQDRRIVIMDEVSGLTPDHIAQMSSIRSSGEAQLTKIRSEKTYARTRLLWLGNPRQSKMSDYTYGVQAIRPLVGNNEDVARFDLAMVVKSSDVAADEINSSHHEEVEHVYTSDLCHQLLLWVWSRTPGQIKWASGAEQAVLDHAITLGQQFTEDPPLVQAANVRIKLARVAVAIAGRVFSSDKTGENLVVQVSHVKAAYNFLLSLYESGNFGYHDMSREQLMDDEMARGFAEEVEDLMDSMPMMAKFLRGSAKFKRADLEDVLSMTREESQALINQLWDRRMFRRDGPYLKCTPVLQEILRRNAP